MTAESIGATLGLWASSLRDLKRRRRPLFTQERAAPSGVFLDGLSLALSGARPAGSVPEGAGDPGPSRQPAILGRGRRCADGLREIVRENAMETLVDPAAELVLDETAGRD